MKTLQVGLSALLLSTTLLLGANTINEQIEGIQKASPQERADMMNKLKVELASMNKEERANAISTLRLKMDGKAINTGTSSMFQRIQQVQSGQQGNIIQQNSMSSIQQQNGMSSIQQNGMPTTQTTQPRGY